MVIEKILKYKRIGILGPSGTGRTSLAMFIARKDRDSGRKVFFVATIHTNDEIRLISTSRGIITDGISIVSMIEDIGCERCSMPQINSLIDTLAKDSTLVIDDISSLIMAESIHSHKRRNTFQNVLDMIKKAATKSDRIICIIDTSVLDNEERKKIRKLFDVIIEILECGERRKVRIVDSRGKIIYEGLLDIIDGREVL